MRKPLVLLFQLLQTLQLLPAHSAIELAPAIVCLLRDADLTNCICDRHSSSLQHLTWRSFVTVSYGFGRFPVIYGFRGNRAHLNPPIGPLQLGNFSNTVRLTLA